MPLPDGRYTQLLVPEREAQEAASFSLIGRAELDAERDDPSSGWVIAHEMAHQWWGNLVTCEDWSEFWLHEGLATFMVAAWKEHRFGEAAYRAELEVASRRLARAREIGFDKPLTWDGKYPSLGARRAVQYSKGALFLAHLRELVGDDAFWSGLRSLYASPRRRGRSVSRDFQAAMEEASGRDLSNSFDEWSMVPPDLNAGLALPRMLSWSPDAHAKPTTMTRTTNRLHTGLTILVLLIAALMGAGVAMAQTAAPATDDRVVAITFDDLPLRRRRGGAERQDAVAAQRRIVRTLRRNRIPATGFVNEDKMEALGSTGPRLLAEWNRGRLELANHGYSHFDSNELDIAGLEQQIVAGESTIGPLTAAAGRSLRFFRFPYNHVGDTGAQAPGCRGAT